MTTFKCKNITPTAPYIVIKDLFHENAISKQIMFSISSGFMALFHLNYARNEDWRIFALFIMIILRTILIVIA